ncbi:MAG: metallophosphoesterase [Planctomycetes bacterium]|nr:metallophosphoesterase [Planctomycetota bacterium]
MRIIFGIFLLIYSAMHYYVYSRVAGGLDMSPVARSWLKNCLIAAALSFVLAETICRNTASLWFKPVYYFGVCWFGALAVAVVVFLTAHIIGMALRSDFCRYWLTICAIAAIFIISAYSIINVARGPVIKSMTIKYKKLPAELSGLSIVQLSDLHLNLMKSEKWLNDIVDTANSQNPDIIVFTGDLMDTDLSETKRFYSGLKRLKAKNGVFAVSGNHDFYAGLEGFQRVASDTGMTVLRNKKTTAISGLMDICGIDDNAGGEIRKGKAGLLSKLDLPAGLDKDKFTVLLSHRPDVFIEAVKSGIDLQLSGHTHAGQIPPMDLIIQFYYKYPYGLYRDGGSFLYTTCGTDIWGPPMRLFSRSEIVKIVLEKE